MGVACPRATRRSGRPGFPATLNNREHLGDRPRRPDRQRLDAHGYRAGQGWTDLGPSVRSWPTRSTAAGAFRHEGDGAPRARAVMLTRKQAEALASNTERARYLDSSQSQGADPQPDGRAPAPHSALHTEEKSKARRLGADGKNYPPRLDRELPLRIRELAGQGLTVREIADRLGCSVGTAHRYRH